MRTLIYVPIINTSSDPDSLTKEDLWEKHKKTINGFWDVVSKYFDTVDVSGMKVYQDGMIAEGEIGREVAKEAVKTGSRNHELVLRLLNKGASLVKTEDFKLLKEKHDKLLTITQAKSLTKKVIAFIKYKLTEDALLSKRGKFITERIDLTLRHGEWGIIFIGVYHNIKKLLPKKDFQIIEVKDTKKVKEYQSLLPFYKNNVERFEELSKYLISPV